MEQVFAKMLEKAVRDLELLERKGHIQFKVLAGDKSYGALEVKAKGKTFKKKKSPSVYPLGELRDYVLPFIGGLKADEIVSIPVSKYAPEHVRGNVCAWCSTKWGKGTYSSTYNKETKCVEIYRHAN